MQVRVLPGSCVAPGRTMFAQQIISLIIGWLTEQDWQPALNLERCGNVGWVRVILSCCGAAGCSEGHLELLWKHTCGEGHLELLQKTWDAARVMLSCRLRVRARKIGEVGKTHETFFPTIFEKFGGRRIWQTRKYSHGTCPSLKD